MDAQSRRRKDLKLLKRARCGAALTPSFKGALLTVLSPARYRDAKCTQRRIDEQHRKQNVCAAGARRRRVFKEYKSTINSNFSVLSLTY